MGTHELTVFEDRLAAGDRLDLGAASRVVYVVDGTVDVTGATSPVTAAANHTWHGTTPATLTARAVARVWRWEVRAGATPPAGTARVLLTRSIDLPDAACLLRADRVDFPPGGIAYTHTHRGPGIRVLLRGRFRVETGGRTLALGPGEAWFESGPEPVYAEASADEPTSFVRVMVLPRALLGKSSIRYVNPEDQARPKTQTYTVFVDAPIEA